MTLIFVFGNNVGIVNIANIVLHFRYLECLSKPMLKIKCMDADRKINSTTEDRKKIYRVIIK